MFLLNRIPKIPLCPSPAAVTTPFPALALEWWRADGAAVAAASAPSAAERKSGRARTGDGSGGWPGVCRRAAAGHARADGRRSGEPAGACRRGGGGSGRSLAPLGRARTGDSSGGQPGTV